MGLNDWQEQQVRSMQQQFWPQEQGEQQQFVANIQQFLYPQQQARLQSMLNHHHRDHDDD
ncbi:MAG: hypothetical protein ACYCW6_07880 [Candidatus Xenobia bacterium]